MKRLRKFYGAGKSAIDALTPRHGQRVARVRHPRELRAPGAVISERVTGKAGRMTERAKAGRDPSSETGFTGPEKLANGIVFLLSDLASGISGQNLTVDRALST